MRSVKFCDSAMYTKFKKIHLITDYIETKQKEFDDYNKKHNPDVNVATNGQRLTNLGVFRKYLELYLVNHPKVNKKHTILVRQLQPAEFGIPIEVFVFSIDQKFEDYENIQSDLFDYILAIIPEFDLKVFQNPTGEDFKKLIN